MPSLRISDVAAQIGVPSTTLRYYEDVGLLKTRRSPGGYRIYDEHTIERLRFISSAKRLRLPLAEIATLLQVWDSASCRTVKQQLRPLLTQRISDLQQDRAALDELNTQLTAALRQLDHLPDRDSACDPSCTFLDQPQPHEPAVACSLNPSQLPDRFRRWQELLDQAPRTPIPRGVLIDHLPAARSADLVALIVAEQQCCPFLSFQLSFAGSTLQLRITAPDGAEGLVLALVNDLTQEVTTP